MAAIPPFAPPAPVFMGGQNFSIYTQNMQGGCNVGYATGAIRRHDVTFLQECGSPGFLNRAVMAPVAGLAGVSTGTLNFGTSRCPDSRSVVYHNNGRCSQVVLINTELLTTPAGIVVPPTPFLIPAPAAALRPIVGGTVNGVSFGSFHAPSGNHAAAEGVLRHQLNAALATNPNFVFGGDANSDITHQTNPGTIQAFASPVPTHQGGGNLDGMVCSTAIHGTPLQPMINTSSDHVIGLSGNFHT